MAVTPSIADPVLANGTGTSLTPHDEDPFATQASRIEPGSLGTLSDGREIGSPGWPAIPGYEILGELGHGGMGVVYRARQLKLNRLVALKMILAGPQAGPEDLQRFVAEAESIAQVQHPNIVQVHEIGQHDRLPYFAMEYVAGGSLAHRVKGTPVEPGEAARLTEMLARGVQAAHQRGIIHRDLKPANVLLEISECGLQIEKQPAASTQSAISNLQSAIPKITDFGLAKHLESDSGLTRTGQLMGTPSYMPPEQALGEIHKLGPACDIYALGAILYELLTGRPPFRGTSVTETLDQVVNQEVVWPSRLRPKLPRDLETICLKCLEKQHHKRYATAAELAQDLNRFLNLEPIHARRATPLERLRKWAQRRPAVAALWSVVLVAVLALTGLMFWHFDDLQSQLAEARADEQQAQQQLAAAKQETERRRLEGDVRTLISQSRVAVVRDDWDNATLQIGTALDRLDQAATAMDDSSRDGILAELSAQANEVKREIDQRKKARSDYADFLAGRDKALFYESAVTGLDAKTNRRLARGAARQALSLFLSGQGTFALPLKYLSRGEENEIRSGCYQLLLVWAECVAAPAVGEDGDFAAALDLLERASKLRAAATRAYHLRRARYADKLGKQAEAKEERARALDLPSTDDLDSFLVGEDELRHGNIAEAIRHLQEAATTNPSNFWAHYFLGVAHMSPPRPRSDLARASFTTCLSLGRKPDFPWVYLLRAFAASDLGDFAAAEADFARAQTLARDLEARCGLLVNRGYLRIAQARAIPADELQAAAAIFPADSAPLQAATLLAKQQRDRKLHDAVADLRHAITLKPDQYNAYVNLAQALRLQTKVPEARVQLDRAVEKFPTLAVLYRERAQIHLQENHEDRALADLERAIELESGKSNKAGDLVQKGQILYRNGRHAAAVKAARDAIAAQPTNAKAHLLCAQGLLMQGAHREALAALNQFERFGQPSAAFHVARGLIRGKLDNHKGSLSDFGQALALKPDAATYVQRGWLYLLAFRSPRLALADFDEALRRAPDLAEARSGRGNARVLLGSYQDAVNDAEASLRAGPAMPRMLTHAARIFAQAAAQVRAGPAGSRRSALDTADRFQRRALALLRQALTATPEKGRVAFWRSFIEPDVAFRDLWRTPEYARLASFAAAGSTAVEN